ncbi:MAG: hypothetical protein K2H56_01200 [Malacoplasma sp.]|nr:hypothetical protein [Malacoplasma sp.]
MKRKILTSALVATAAIASGIAPSILAETNTQSNLINADDSSPNIPDNPSDKTDDSNNPNTPDESKDPSNPDDNTPDDPTPEEPTLLTATSPSFDFFNYQTKYIGSLDDKGLENFLSDIKMDEIFEESQQNETPTDQTKISLKNYLKNINQYKNVKISYIENSASWFNKSFQVLVTPINGAEWKDKTTNSKNVLIFIKDFAVSDATAPKTAKLVENVGNPDTTLTDGNLDALLSQSLDKNWVTIQPKEGENFANCTISYVPGSASIANKNFKITVKPNENHKWKGTVENNERQIIVDIPYVNWAGNTVFLPLEYAVNALVNSDFRYEGYTVNEYNMIYEDAWAHVFGYLHPNAKALPTIKEIYLKGIKKFIFDAAVKDLQRNYKVDILNTYENCTWEVAYFTQSGTTEFQFQTNVKPKDGCTWYGGGTQAKKIRIQLWVSNTRIQKGPGIGSVDELTLLSNVIDYYLYDNKGLPSQWVSSNPTFPGFNGSQDSIKKLKENILKELNEKFRPWYSFEVSNIRTLDGSSYINQPWKFDIKFTSLASPSTTKTIPGYVFVY